MSSIQVQNVLQALDKPSTMKSMARKTGYPERRIREQLLIEARAAGYIIRAVPREGEPTYFMVHEAEGTTNE